MKLILLLTGLLCVGCYAYIPLEKEHYMPSDLLRDVVSRMNNKHRQPDLDSPYLDFPDARDFASSLAARAFNNKADDEEQMYPFDYDAALGGGGGQDLGMQPSMRDREYLQSNGGGGNNLWGSQYMSGGAGEGNQRLKPEGTLENRQEVKTDATLPAYCNPPNPCPIGYSAENGCLEEFKNTASFSRRYQAEQDCMCDSEHMFDCPSSLMSSDNGNMDSETNDLDLNRFIQQAIKDVSSIQHKNLVAKKFHSSYNMQSFRQNPFLAGEKLPVAAKKGFGIGGELY